jgi:Toprim domain
MPRDASELARRLARDAEAVCRHYLSKGRRQGRYWTVGDVRNTPGRSMFVRLSGPDSGPGAAGRWTDAASAEHGDLLDVIRESCGLVEFREVAEEARRFLALPRAEPSAAPRPPAPQGSPEAARRLWAMAKPLAGTLAEAYLHARGITDLRGCQALRFHPRCWYRGGDDEARDQARDAWPALVAAVTALDGSMTGAHRTWLDPASACKAPVSTPRRAMGLLLGNGVRFGRAVDVMVAGEGLETILALRQVMPTMLAVAALSANHLAALELPADLRRLYLARDNDLAGRHAVETLAGRARAAGVEALTLVPALADFNEDLRRLGADVLRDGLRAQMSPDDRPRLRST